MFGNLLKKFVKTAFVSIIKDGNICDVCLKVYKGKTELSSDTKRFSTNTPESSKLLYDFVLRQYDKYSIVYSASIINTINQGGLPGCDKRNFHRYSVDTTNASVVCVDKTWSIFASNYDIENTKKDYADLGGLDFLFSPIVVLKRFFDDTLTSEPMLCILKQDTSATIAILTKNNLLFSGFAVLDAASENKSSSSKDDEKIFGDEEDLDKEGLIDLDDLAFGLKNGGDFDFGGTDAGDSSNAVKEMESLSGDLRILEFVKTSLADFYKNEMYESTFIEKIAIADLYFDSPELKNLLEKKLMMSVTHKKIELSKITATLAAEEVLF